MSVVTTWFPSARNPGAGSFIERDARALARDHDLEVIHLVSAGLDDGRRVFDLDGLSVRRVPVDPRTPGGLLSVTRNLGRILAGRDIVHSMAAPALLPFLLRRPTSPWIHTEHWSGLPRFADSRGAARLASPFLRRGFSGPAEVIAVSEYLAAHVRAYRRGPVEVIGNIVEMPVIPVRRRSDRRLRVLGVSNVIERKGWHLAVNAVRGLRARGHDVELVWLGDGPQHGELLRLGGDVVASAPGRANRHEIAQHMADADVFVLPTDTETFSLATVEALAAGLPVVVTGEGAHTAFVTPEVGRVANRAVADIEEAILDVRDFDRDAIRSRGAELLSVFSESEHRRAYGLAYERVQR